MRALVEGPREWVVDKAGRQALMQTGAAAGEQVAVEGEPPRIDPQCAGVLAFTVALFETRQATKEGAAHTPLFVIDDQVAAEHTHIEAARIGIGDVKHAAVGGHQLAGGDRGAGIGDLTAADVDGHAVLDHHIAGGTNIHRATGREAFADTALDQRLRPVDVHERRALADIDRQRLIADGTVALQR